MRIGRHADLTIDTFKHHEHEQRVIFADSLSSELVTPTGTAASGYAATFQVGI
jgi:hypothetical protein